MAARKNLVCSDLAVKYSMGLDKEGKDVIKKTTYPNLKHNAGPEDINAVVDAMADIMDNGIFRAEIVDTYSLTK